MSHYSYELTSRRNFIISRYNFHCLSKCFKKDDYYLNKIFFFFKILDKQTHFFIFLRLNILFLSFKELILRVFSLSKIITESKNDFKFIGKRLSIYTNLIKQDQYIADTFDKRTIFSSITVLLLTRHKYK